MPEGVILWRRQIPLTQMTRAGPAEAATSAAGTRGTFPRKKSHFRELQAFWTGSQLCILSNATGAEAISGTKAVSKRGSPAGQLNPGMEDQ
ncbi:hypothetical protein chiPu_0007604 [Chiloscyllium punctatum]|uniref:Uncharacterized protein n=1 Tax=Chiloscyllium punctatum TaxID=137246 RepID=A0A401SFI2_CHIPU|nr:hypothetical protein [Chiloscyllium punctatum]